ncbi:hypothetical protein NHN17_16655 [Photobacterium sp. ZSDE20]|uniref:Uncharacterized protein n=1 Tax=Photobacterium pectinilyticum TaxID=2906793 RepID=A0ABT1N4P1_9GAMM|nr:hypothetical protein [Photobacterium sp. ZSDE20]MCQ1059680.1 hypothetical protein [Photobacterium sp. ZSDE20]
MKKSALIATSSLLFGCNGSSDTPLLKPIAGGIIVYVTGDDSKTAYLSNVDGSVN